MNIHFKVSIIIPVYNLGLLVKNAINSCLNQSYSNFEIIIINDGSTDNTEDFILSYLPDSRIKYYRQDNSGVSSARNRGIEMAEGDYILFLDGDDILQNDTIEKNIQLIQSYNQRIDWLAYPIIRVDINGNKISENYGNLLGTYDYQKICMISEREAFKMYENQQIPPIICAMMFHRNFFDKRFIEGRFEDSYMFLELLAKHPQILLSPYGAYIYVNRENSFINAPFSAKKWLDYTRVKIKYIQTGLLLFPELSEKYIRSTSLIYYNLKYLKFKNRKNIEYSSPLVMFEKSMPIIKKDIFLWGKYILKCIASLFIINGDKKKRM